MKALGVSVTTKRSSSWALTRLPFIALVVVATGGNIHPVGKQIERCKY